MADKLKRVLIIEDESDLLDSYAEVLISAGYEVLKALDGYAGLKLLESEKDTLSLVLLDLMMPGIDGLEVLRSVHDHPEKYGKMPVVVLTNMTSDKVVKEAFDLGAYSYLVKTELEIDDLLKEVNRAIENDK